MIFKDRAACAHEKKYCSQNAFWSGLRRHVGIALQGCTFRPEHQLRFAMKNTNALKPERSGLVGGRKKKRRGEIAVVARSSKRK